MYRKILSTLNLKAHYYLVPPFDFYFVIVFLNTQKNQTKKQDLRGRKSK